MIQQGQVLAELHAAGRSTGRTRSPTPATCKRTGARKSGPSPVDRGRRGSKHRLLVDGGSIPLAWLHNRSRLRVRTDRRHETHESFLALACCDITWQRLQASSAVSGFLE